MAFAGSARNPGQTQPTVWADAGRTSRRVHGGRWRSPPQALMMISRPNPNDLKPQKDGIAVAGGRISCGGSLGSPGTRIQPPKIGMIVLWAERTLGAAFMGGRSASFAHGPCRRRLRSMRPWSLPLLLTLAGCAGSPHDSRLGAHWPDADELGRAAVAAAKSPRTWGPLTAAALLSIGDLDDDVSSWSEKERPLFGSRAAEASDFLVKSSYASFLVSALAVRSERVPNRLGRLGVGTAALLLQGGVIDRLKAISRQPRPDGVGRLTSFPSGHAGAASAATTLTARNLEYIDMPAAARTGAAVGLEALAAGTAWARVEARRHYIDDALVGYAIGHFVATFVQDAFIEQRWKGAAISFQPMEGGGILRLALPFSPVRRWLR